MASTRRLYTRRDKQIALACFRAGLSPKLVADKLGFVFTTVQEWHSSFLKHRNDWAKFDDKDLQLRQAALELFEQGNGYKKVATQLQLPTSRVKYCLRQYKYQKEFFFTSGSNNFKYSDEKRTAVLNAYAVSTLSKKVFCAQHKISVPTLNNWLRKEQRK